MQTWAIRADAGQRVQYLMYLLYSTVLSSRRHVLAELNSRRLVLVET